jgi:hypothetical protein
MPLSAHRQDKCDIRTKKRHNHRRASQDAESKSTNMLASSNLGQMEHCSSHERPIEAAQKVKCNKEEKDE